MNALHAANPANPFMNPQPESTLSTLVLGLGETGYSVVEYLSARGGKVSVADSRDIAPCLARVRERYPTVQVISGGLPLDSLDRYDRVVVSPGIALPTDVSGVADAAGGRPVIGDIELFAQNAVAPIIAITGSNGKSTVTTLVAKMLAAAGCNALAGGNLGPPALSLLACPVPDFYVLELSSFQLEHTHTLRAAAAAILNISEDHQDRYRDIGAYTTAKARILKDAGVRVLNRDDPASAALLAAHPEAVTFGLGPPDGARHYGLAETARGRFLSRGGTTFGAVSRLALHGEQNVANVLAALALVESAGVDATPPAVDAALGWGGLEHRCEWVAEIRGVPWINDSKGTNVGATVAALGGFGDDLILIAGGLGKGADFAPLRDPVRERVRCAVLFGKDAGHIADAIAGCTEVVRARDLAQAVSIAARYAQAGAGRVVLFSPACASFDGFENYEQRGRAFKELVAALKAGEAGEAES